MNRCCSWTGICNYFTGNYKQPISRKANIKSYMATAGKYGIFSKETIIRSFKIRIAKNTIGTKSRTCIH